MDWVRLSEIEIELFREARKYWPVLSAEEIHCIDFPNHTTEFIEFVNSQIRKRPKFDKNKLSVKAVGQFDWVFEYDGIGRSPLLSRPLVAESKRKKLTRVQALIFIIKESEYIEFETIGHE
jgi:hypothetical protein